MPALMLNKSSRVMPGLRATPAVMTTTWAPSRQAGSWSLAGSLVSPKCAVTLCVNDEGISAYLGVGVDVAEVSGDAGNSDQVVQREMADEGIGFEQQGQRLTWRV